MFQPYHRDRSAWGASHRDLGDKSAWGTPHRDPVDMIRSASHRDKIRVLGILLTGILDRSTSGASCRGPITFRS